MLFFNKKRLIILLKKGTFELNILSMINTTNNVTQTILSVICLEII